VNLALVVNPTKASTLRVLQRMRQCIAASSHRLFLWEPAAAELRRRTDCDDQLQGYTLVDDVHAGDVVLALGGDGTLLTAVRLLGDDLRPLLGINLGSLGFLTDTPEERAEEALTQLLAGKYRLDLRMLLEVEHRPAQGERARALALNDVVLHGPSARVLEVSLQADDVDLGSTMADGMIVATPSGSTAYSLSAGGPIVSPRLRALIVTPISAHTLALRPLVLSAEEGIEIRLLRTKFTQAEITVDGHFCWSMHSDDTLVVRAASQNLQMVVTQGRSFYHTLRSKLGWGHGRRAGQT
jgi:NAD+ kinase